MEFITGKENFNDRGITTLFVPDYVVGNPVSDKMLSNIEFYFRNDLNNSKPDGEVLLSKQPNVTITDVNNRKIIYGLKDIGIPESDIIKLLTTDAYIKTYLGLPVSTDVDMDNVKLSRLARESEAVLKSLTIDKEVSDSYIQDIAMSNIEKPYNVRCTNNILFIVMHSGFGNLLLSNQSVFAKMLTSDIVREYQNHFGTSKLHSSVLFNVYLQKLDTYIYS